MEIKNQDGETLFRKATQKMKLQQFDTVIGDLLLRLPSDLGPGEYKIVAGIDRMTQGTIHSGHVFVVENDALKYAGRQNGPLNFPELSDGQWEASR